MDKRLKDIMSREASNARAYELLKLRFKIAMAGKKVENNDDTQ